MAWLKYQISHAAGYEPPEFVELKSTHPHDVETMRAWINAEYGDGLRMPRFEVLDELPIETLHAKIALAEKELGYAQQNLDHLRELYRAQMDNRRPG